MSEAETDLGIVCRLAHEHLGDGGSISNDVLRRLPRLLRGGVDDVVKDIATSVDVPANLMNADKSMGFIYQRLVTYQIQNNHHQPPGRLGRLTNQDNFHAKRTICELLKAWAVSCQSMEDEAIDAAETESYNELVTHLLYYHDRWSGKMWAADNFMDALVAIHRRLDDVFRAASNSRHKYLKILERIHESSMELVDNALRVTIFAASDGHAELDDFQKRNGSVSLKSLALAGCKSGTSFWCSDFGQVVDSALIQGDPERFKPQGVIEGVPAVARRWWVFVHEIGHVKMYEFRILEDAKQKFDTCKYCALLVGPEGKLQDKKFITNKFISSVLNDDDVVKELNVRAEQFLELHAAACCTEEVDAYVDGYGSDTPSVPSRAAKWQTSVRKIRDRWMAGFLDQTGVAEPFRGAKRLKWVEGVFEKVAKSSDFPSIILDVPMKFADLLRVHCEVMGAVRGMIREGGSKEALAAIYALRQQAAISGRLSQAMDEFITASGLVQGFFHLEFSKAVEGGRKVKGQVPALQRQFYESYKSCDKLRKKILTDWHELGLKVTDSQLSEEAKRIDISEREAFAKLMGMPSPLAIAGPNSVSSMLALPPTRSTGSRLSSGPPSPPPESAGVDVQEVGSDEETELFKSSSVPAQLDAFLKAACVDGEKDVGQQERGASRSNWDARRATHSDGGPFA